MDKAALCAELKMLGIRSAWLDLAAWCISNLIFGLNLRYALGLLLGTAVLFINLLILYHSISLMAYDAKRTGKASTARHARYYLLRLAIFAAAFSAALLLPAWIAPIGVAIPPLYPRLVYTTQAVFNRQNPNSKAKKR